MANSEHFCLRWNDFESNINQAFQSIREEKDFFDVTLACEDEQVQAHKVILSACSPFFRNILRKNPHQHPLLFLKGVRYSDITSILNFMYHGEVNVTQGDLNTFLSVAEDLQVKGLTQENSKAAGWRSGESQKSVQKKPPENDEVLVEPPIKRSRSDAGASRNAHHEVETVTPVKTEPVTETMVGGVVSLEPHEEVEGVYDPNYDCFYQEEGQFVQEGEQGGDRLDGNKETQQTEQIKIGTEQIKIGNSSPEDLVYFERDPTLYSKKNWRCKLCGEYFHNRGNAMNHVEAKHLDVNYECKQCSKVFKSRNSWKTHKSVYHSQGAQQHQYNQQHQNYTNQYH